MKLLFNDQINKEFHNYHSTSLIQLYRISFILTIFLFAVFGILDNWVIPNTKHIAWFIRFCIVIPYMLFVLIISFTKYYTQFNQYLISFGALLSGYGIIFMWSFSNQFELGFETYYAGLSLIFLYLFLFIRFYLATIICVLILIGYYFVSIFHFKMLTVPTGRLILINNSFFILTATVLGILGGYFIEYIKKISYLQKIEIEKKNEKLNFELKLSKIILSKVLPRTIPILQKANINLIYKPCNELGGDFYDFIHFRDNNLIGLFVCDSIDNGISGALIASMLKSILNTSSDKKLYPDILLYFLNETLKKQLDYKNIDAFYGIYDSSDRILRFSTIGEKNPVLISNNIIQDLNPSSHQYNIQNEIVISRNFKKLKENDKLLIYSKGLLNIFKKESKINYKLNFFQYLEKNINLPIKHHIQSIYTDLQNQFQLYNENVFLLGLELE